MTAGADGPGTTAAANGPDRGSRLGSCPRPLCEEYDAALLDLDGVLYLGTEPIAHAAEAVRAVRAAGMRTAFVTNNASRRPDSVAAHLVELGIPAAADDVVTSAQAAVRVLRDRVPERSEVLVVGSSGLADELTAGGFRPVRTAGPGVRAVVQGYDRETGWEQLAEASLALQAGAVWVATNTDSTLPSPRGRLPGNGALVAALEVATGLRPLVAGKPEPALHQESVVRVGARCPLVVGDRLDTDVLGAVRGGADSLLVLTGVVDLPAAMGARRGMRPSYVSSDLRGLLAAHPKVEVGSGEASTKGASAVLRDAQIHVRGEGDAALRVVCALAWACLDGGVPVDGVRGLEQ